jgi:hypothetical protein
VNGQSKYFGPRTRIGRIVLSAITTAIVVIATLGLAGTPTVAAATTGIFSDTMTPTNPGAADQGAVELGVRFSPQQSGKVTALQYYQGSRATGVTTATLWSSTGTALATARFDATTTAGWRTIALTSPVALTAGNTYVASYYAPKGGYPVTQSDLLTDKTLNGFTLKAGAGVYRYGSPGSMPSRTYKGSNYLVDVVYVTSTGTVPTTSTSTKPTTSSSSATLPPTSAPTAPSAPPSTSGGVVVLGRTFPSAATTGVPQGTTLSTYTGPCSIQTNNVVIDAKIINCDLRVLAQGVIITRSIINGTIYSDPDYFNGSFTLTDSEVKMKPATGTGIGDVNFVVTRVEVTGGSRSINCAANCTVQDSYLHGQYTDQRGIDHESAVRMGSNSVIRHNYITCDATPVPPDAGCSAGITGYGDFAIVQQNTIDNNVIDGGPYGSMGYCAYGGSTTGKPYSAGVNNIKFTNNIFRRGPNGKCGIWGPITSFDSNAPGNVWTNNLWDDGATVPPAN